MTPSLPPQLPSGNASTLSTLSQSFSFHSSPETFISSRSRPTTSSSNPSSDSSLTDLSKSPIVRARILNRDVAIITSHQFCTDVLNAGNALQSSISAGAPGAIIDGNTFVAREAYDELMSAFFPPPNLLLADGEEHTRARKRWQEQMSSFSDDVAGSVTSIMAEHIAKWKNGDWLDIYESMKELSWKILLKCFLELEAEDKGFGEIEELQEALLRGQFSLFPVAVTVGLWRSPRSKGVAARKKLQSLLPKWIESQSASCPFLQPGKVGSEELSSNALLFTSSIAVKALASLLTATILNLWFHPNPQHQSAAARIRCVRHDGDGNADLLLNSMILETERLSPPVIGVMRRVTTPIIFKSPDPEKPDTLVPAGWDVWLYLSGANRDEAKYANADTFLPERFVANPDAADAGFAFGGGTKTCLGKGLVRKVVKLLVEGMLDAGIEFKGSVARPGLRTWLGWDGVVDVEALARDMKQLPVQRPKLPFEAYVSRMSLNK